MYSPDHMLVLVVSGIGIAHAAMIIRSDGVYGGINDVYDEGDYHVRHMYNAPPLALNVAIGPVDAQDRFIVD